ncbi:hypothetical protein GGI25_000696 [Coemansia spiralis]|uniref:HD domain-containing protein n=2 Tax=Coemansia TaxID=4863 RepID=A0A9W8GBS6_9FUNG|nr:HD phosphohydrolase domain-containing protein [Coemansia spiralis]KAJ1995720.1 hypothetical protein EDC05_000654 [Coemansia umbellata]KAJ2623676.1 hypothetical protein GGI26_002123 [Coemansia sp. RSA 1358]KAJ2680404.1 hypothetical protein GGI25_000696 [Coemansia spiralis]
MKSRALLRRGFTDMDLDGSASTLCVVDEVKYINDPIHGYINLSNYTLDFIDTPQFQRLRNIKQMGSSYHVFPGASHNRFEHSIGTSFLANGFVQGLALRQPELEIDERDIRCVTLAGLCHDLGHGPFSHMFDNAFIPHACPGIEWSHEQGSELMLDHTIDENNIDIAEDDISLIKKLIQGTTQPVGGEKMFLFDIVANKRNGVDTDKFDYIQRDCYNVGIKSSYDFSRLMLNSRVIDDEVCYSYKEAYNLTEMFHTRYSLHKRIYSHRAAKAIELMIVDALLAADPVLQISQAISDPNRYQQLTDDVVRDIERSKEPELKEARNLIARIHKRDIYKFVDEFILPPELASVADRSVINEAEIVGHRSTNDGFVEKDVLVEFSCIHYGMGKENPVDHIKFYSKYSIDEKFPIASEFISMCVPEKYEERIVRIFTRTASKRGQIQRAARRLMEKLNATNENCLSSSSPPNITPNRGLTLPGDPSLADIKRRRLEFI